MRAKGALPKRIIGALYSAAAERIYEPLVVRGSFRLLGGDLEEPVREQGRGAVEAAAETPILDMPVGTAHFALDTARAHPSIVVGADLAEGMVRQARRAARERGADNLLTLQADAHHLPFPDATFGAVMCTNGLQVIPGLDRTLSELARVTRPSGRIFVCVLHLPVGAAVPPHWAAKLPNIMKGRAEFCAALRAAGFDSVRVSTRRLATFIEARRTAD